MNASIAPTLLNFAEESNLLERLRSGDDDAYEQLVRDHGGRMLAVARRMMRDEEDCADAVQDAFVSALQALPTFRGQSSLGTWLHRIVVNACLMRLRGKSRRPASSLDQLLPAFDETGHHVRSVETWDATAPALAENAELRGQVRACIDSLPAPYREVLILRDIEEFDTETTARMLNTNAAVVKTRLHRARQALRTLLEPLVAN